MIYLQKHKKYNFWKTKYFKLLVLILVIFILSFFDTTRIFISDVASHSFRFGYYINSKISFLPNLFRNKYEVMYENQNLKEELASVYYEINKVELVEMENKRLREILELKDDNLIASMILTRYPQTASDTIVIDKGRNDGLSRGDLVFVGDRVLIGKIVETFGNSSIVTLSSFPNNILYGSILNTLEPIEINGVGRGVLRATVPLDFSVKVGDIIVVTQPYSYAVAVVNFVEEDTSFGVKNLFLSIPADLFRQSVVLVRKIEEVGEDL